MVMEKIDGRNFDLTSLITRQSRRDSSRIPQIGAYDVWLRKIGYIWHPTAAVAPIKLVCTINTGKSGVCYERLLF